MSENEWVTWGWGGGVGGVEGWDQELLEELSAGTMTRLPRSRGDAPEWAKC